MNRKYNLNQEYFDKIDTNEKAYILGFLAADGNIKNDGFIVRFLIHMQDIEILEFIKKELNYSGPIKIVRTKYRLLELNSTKLVKAVKNYGIEKRKTRTLQPPKNLDNKFYNSFIRGYFDGDGCVALYNRATYKKPYIVISSTKELLSWIQQVIGTNYKLVHNKKVPHNYALNFSKLEAVLKFSKLMKFEFALKRKTILLDKCAAYCEQSSRIKNLNNGESLNPDKITSVASTN